ncbi:MAG: hypothetical protein RMM51_01170 [Verrucomicrobiae bacterium]|nr:hypothetical protein [Verrucomicrobiae bacterium]
MTRRDFLIAGAWALVLGCTTPKPVTLRFHEQANPSLPSSRVRFVPVSGTEQWAVNPFPSLTERDVAHAQVVGNLPGAVMVQFSAHGALVLNELTTRARGMHVVVLVDEKPVMVWRIDRRVTDGQFLLRTDLPPERVQALVDYLNYLARPRL